MIQQLNDDFATFGARHFKGALLQDLVDMEAALANVTHDEAGVRLQGIALSRLWTGMAKEFTNDQQRLA